MTRWMIAAFCTTMIWAGPLTGQQITQTEIVQTGVESSTKAPVAVCESKCATKSCEAPCKSTCGDACKSKCQVAKTTCQGDACQSCPAEGFTWSFPLLTRIPFVTDSPKAQIGVEFDIVEVDSKCQSNSCQGNSCETKCEIACGGATCESPSGPYAIVHWLNKEIAEKEAATCRTASSKACDAACTVSCNQQCDCKADQVAQKNCPVMDSLGKSQCPLATHAKWFTATAEKCPVAGGKTVVTTACPKGKCQCGDACQCSDEKVAKLKRKLEKTEIALMVQETIAEVRYEAGQRERQLERQLAEATAKVQSQQAVIELTVKHQEQQQQWLAFLATQQRVGQPQPTQQQAEQVEQLASENARLRAVVEELQQHIRQANQTNPSNYSR